MSAHPQAALCTPQKELGAKLRSCGHKDCWYGLRGNVSRLLCSPSCGARCGDGWERDFVELPSPNPNTASNKRQHDAPRPSAVCLFFRRAKAVEAPLRSSSRSAVGRSRSPGPDDDPASNRGTPASAHKPVSMETCTVRMLWVCCLAAMPAVPSRPPHPSTDCRAHRRRDASSLVDSQVPRCSEAKTLMNHATSYDNN